MLMITIPIMSSLIMPILFKNYWWSMMSTMFILTLLSLTNMSTSTMSISTFSLSDTMSSALITLSILIAGLMMLASSKIINFMNNHKLFACLNLILLLILVLCFSAAHIMSFYVWFEASLIPTMLIIMTWGYQPERMQASMYLMMYTITASLPMLIIFILVNIESGHNLMTMWTELVFPSQMMSCSIFWLVFLGGFLVKLPMFSVHLWLPKAHVEAPIAGSMVLAAILLKLGGYGLARMMLMFSKFASTNISSMLMSIALCGAMFTSFICMRQPDLKSLIAYSSVGHMGVMLAGTMSNSKWGLTGALMMMIAHGLCSSALFIMANISYESTSTRSMFLTKGLMAIAPITSMWWFLFTAANMAAPPSINLLSEIILMSSVLSKSTLSLIPLGMISFLTAAYSLIMFSTTQHGQISSFTNPLLAMKSKDMLLLTVHFLPMLMLILKPEIISSWL